MSIPSSNPQAFGWIKSALTQSMLQAISSLSETGDSSALPSLESVSSNLHQIRGSLKMVELDAASMLAEELENLSDKLSEDTSLDNYTEAVAVLRSGLESLKKYLSAIENGIPRSPLVLVGDINDARRFTGRQLITRYDLFDPPLDLSAIGEFGESLDFSEEKRRLILVDLRKRFRQALLSWLQNKNPEQSLTVMVEMMSHLQKVSDLEVLQQLWWVAAGFIESIREAGIEIDSDIKSQFAKLDVEISRMGEGNRAAIASFPPDNLLRQMLFSIGNTMAANPESEFSDRAMQIVEQLGLDQWFVSAADANTQDEFMALIQEITVLSDEIEPGRMTELENSIELYFSGDLDSEQAVRFFAQLDSLQEAVAGHDVGDLNEFTVALCKSIKRVDPDAESLVQTGADLKIATALLLLKDTLEFPSSVSETWKQSIVDRTVELNRLAEPDQTDQGIDSQARQQAKVELQQAREVVVSEINATLSKIENLISSVNLDDVDKEQQTPIQGYLNDLSDWFEMLESNELSRLAQLTASKYAQMLEGSADFNRKNTEHLAFVIASIGVCAGQAEQESSQSGEIIDRAKLMLDQIIPSIKTRRDEETEVESITSSADSSTDASSLREAEFEVLAADAQETEDAPQMITDTDAKKPESVSEQLDQLDEIRRGVRGSEDEEVQFIRLALIFSEIQDQADSLNNPDMSGLAEIGKSLTQKSIDGEVDFDSEIEDFIGLICRQMRQLESSSDGAYEPGLEEWQIKFESIVEQQKSRTVETVDELIEAEDESSGIDDPELRQIFVDELNQQSGVLSEVLSSINSKLDDQDGSPVKEIITDHHSVIERLVHTLSGNFKNLGFPVIGESLEHLEALVRVETDEISIVEMYRDNLQLVNVLLMDTAGEIEESNAISDTTLARYQSLPQRYEHLQREIIRTAIPFELDDSTDSDNPADQDLDFSIEPGQGDDDLEPGIDVEETRQVNNQISESGEDGLEQEEEVKNVILLKDQDEFMHPEQLADTDIISDAGEDALVNDEKIPEDPDAEEPATEETATEETVEEEPVSEESVTVEAVSDFPDQTDEVEELEEFEDSEVEAIDITQEGSAIAESTLGTEITRQEFEEQELPDDDESTVEETSELAADPDGDDPGYESDDEIRQIFLDESESRLSRINSHLAQWRSSEVSEEILAGIRREFHTLKGSAAASGFVDISNLSHAVESLLEQGGNTTASDDSSLLNLLEEMHDGLAAELGFIPGANKDHIKSLISMVEVLISDEAVKSDFTSPITEESIESPNSRDQAPGDIEDVSRLIVAQQEATMERDVVADGVPGDEKGDDEQAQSTNYWMPPTDLIKASTGRQAADPNIGSLRIENKKLSELLNYSGELGLTRTQLKNTLDATREELDVLRSNTKRIRDGLRDLEFEADSQMRSLPENRDQDTGDEIFDPLQLDRYSRLQARARDVSRQLDELARVERQLSERASDLDGALIQQIHLGEQLQDGLMSTRMISINEYLPRLRQLVRDTSRRLEKPANFDVEGADIEVDRQVLDTMMPPFEHMIRNAIIHGFESGEERARLGKSTSGQISLKVIQQGSELLIEFRDDGEGLDREKLSQRAVETGLVQNSEDSIEDHLLQIITEPGFSTAETISLDSGRGVGLDVVYQAVRTLGGSMALSSQPGEGVSFQFRLPVTMTVSQALLVRVGTYRFALLTRAIERVVRVQADELQLINGQTCIAVGDHTIPVFNLAERIQETSLITDESYKSLVLVRFADRIAAFEVDQFEDIVEIVTKVPGSQLTSIDGVIGVTILADSSIVLILDPGQFVDRSTIRSEAFIPFDHSHGTPDKPFDVDVSSILQRVLVVDDSLVVRKVMQRDIEGLGLEAVVAVDGIDALEMLEENEVDIALIDLEMPRMNGYELLEKIKSDPRYQNLPTIIITSRSGELHRQRALGLGADEYITKPYDIARLKQMMESIVLSKSVKH